MAKLLDTEDGRTYWTETRIETDPAALKGLLNDLRWEILTVLAQRPRYPAEIADELGEHEQKIYYHIRQLKDQGLIEVAEQKHQGGAVAKYYRVTDHAFALELPYADKHLLEDAMPETSPELQSFLSPFITSGRLDADIVVGAPDPHGPHQVQARDAHLAVDLGRFLGQYSRYDRSATRLDVDMKATDNMAGNMIVLGGPLTNMVTAEVNAHLPVRFNQEEFPFRRITSTMSSETYTEDAVGFIARTPNPQNPENAVMVIAGVRMKGTVAAVRALTEHYEDILADYEGEAKWGVVVKGKDMDGDGRIDDIEQLE